MSLLLPTATILLPLIATAWADGRLSSRVITSPLVRMMSDKGGGGGTGGTAGALGSTGGVPATAPAGPATAGAGVAGVVAGFAAAGVGAAGLTAAGAATAGLAAGAGVWAKVWAKSAGAAKARLVARARRRRGKADFMGEAPENGRAAGDKVLRRTRRA